MVWEGEPPTEEEEEYPRRKLPTEQEILQKAIELYMKDHPEAVKHRLTPELLELKAEEGGYLEKARAALMRGPSSAEIEQRLKYLSALRQDIKETVERLIELGVKPEWPPPEPEQLLQEMAKLENRLASMERNVEKVEREKTMLKQQLKTLQKAYEEAKTELAKKEKPIYKTVTVRATQYIPTFIGIDGTAYGPFYPGDTIVLLKADAEKLVKEGLAQPWTKPEITPEKEKLVEEAKNLWVIYRHAILNYDSKTASEAAKRLKELRSQLL